MNLVDGTFTGGLIGAIATFNGNVIANSISITSLNSGKLILTDGILVSKLTKKRYFF